MIMALLAWTAWLLCGPAAGLCQEPPPEGGPWRLGALRFAGFDTVGEKDALEVMETAKPALLIFTQRPALDPAQLERDRLRLIQLYTEQGFFQAQVSYQVEYHPLLGSASVVFKAQENQPTLVDQVELILPEEFSLQLPEQKLRQVLSVKPGERFRLANYEDSKAALAQELSNEGHPLCQVYGQVRVLAQEHKAQVVLQVEPGPRVLFGPSTVEGETRLGSEYILRHLAYVRGQPYNLKALEESQRALLDTGFFASVNLTPDFERMAHGQAPMLVQVKEAKRYSVRLGLGWGNEDQFRLRILQVNRNLLGLNDTLSFEGKLSSIYQGLTGRLKLPDLPGRLTDLVVAGGMEQKDTQAFVNRRLFVTPMLEYRLQRRWWWFVGYNSERDQMREVKTQTPDPSYEKQQFYIASIPLGMRYDSRDDPLDTKRGLYFDLEVETASDALGSELCFTRPQAELRHVLPLPWPQGWALASRAKAGLVYALPGTDRIPLVRRFFPGGADSVRGYPYQLLGPLDSAGKPLGGEAMAEASVELRFPLVEKLGGVVFADAGNAWESVNSNLGSLRYTAGAGLRYATPVGPLRLDLGWQLNPPDNSPLSRYEVYLSVGQAF